MTIRQDITNFLKDKESASLQDIYKGLNADGIAKHNIRAVLNISVKNNGDFKRINKGVYKLNKEVSGEVKPNPTPLNSLKNKEVKHE